MSATVVVAFTVDVAVVVVVVATVVDAVVVGADVPDPDEGGVLYP